MENISQNKYKQVVMSGIKLRLKIVYVTKVGSNKSNLPNVWLRGVRDGLGQYGGY